MRKYRGRGPLSIGRSYGIPILLRKSFFLFPKTFLQILQTLMSEYRKICKRASDFLFFNKIKSVIFEINAFKNKRKIEKK
jgi:preprotein translocase subunit SecY